MKLITLLLMRQIRISKGVIDLIRFINFLFFGLSGFAMSAVAHMFISESAMVWQYIGFATLIVALCLSGFAVYEIIRDKF